MERIHTDPVNALVSALPLSGVAIRSVKDFNPDIRDAYLVLPERPGR